MFEGVWMEREAHFLLKHWQVGGQIKTQEEAWFFLEACGRAPETWGTLLLCAHVAQFAQLEHGL